MAGKGLPKMVTVYLAEGGPGPSGMLPKCRVKSFANLPKHLQSGRRDEDDIAMVDDVENDPEYEPEGELKEVSSADDSDIPENDRPRQKRQDNSPVKKSARIEARRSSRAPKRKKPLTDDEDDDDDKVAVSSPSRRKWSMAWAHYHEVNKNIARCKYCQKMISFRTTLTNLKAHMISQHKDEWTAAEHELIESQRMSVEPATRRKRSILWTYFQQVGNGTAICNLCEKRVSHKTTSSNLKRHLQVNHPTITLESGGRSTCASEASGHEIRRERSPEYDEEEPDAESIVEAEFDPENSQQPTITAFQGDSENGSDEMPDEEIIPDVKTPASTKKKRSSLWDHFTSKGNRMATCKRCSKLISYKTTTSNMKHHLKTKHPEVDLDLSLVSADSQPAASSAGNSATKRVIIATSSVINQVNRKNIDRSLMEMFIKNNQPFSLLKSENFIKFTISLNPNYIPPSMKHMTRTVLPALYKEYVIQVRSKMLQATRACVTADCCDVGTERLISVMAHYNDESLETHHVLLECSALGDFEACFVVARIMQEWGLDSNTERKASLLVTGAGLAGAEISNTSRFECLSYLLDAIVVHSLEQHAKILLEQIRAMADYFGKNPLEEQKSKDADVKLLTRDVDTQWPTTLQMLQQFVELENSIRAVIISVSETDFQAARELIEILIPWEEVSEKLKSDYVLGAMVVVYTEGLLDHCNELSCRPREILSATVLATLTAELKALLKNVEDEGSLGLATLLDPRFKTLGFQDSGHARTVRSRLEKILVEQDPGRSEASPVKTPLPGRPITGLSILSKFLGKVDATRPTVLPQCRGIVELQRYLIEPCLDMEEDPLQWWQQSRESYPFLSKVAKETLCVQATCIPAQLVFTKARRLIRDYCGDRSLERMKYMLFLDAHMD